MGKNRSVIRCVTPFLLETAVALSLPLPLSLPPSLSLSLSPLSLPLLPPSLSPPLSSSPPISPPSLSVAGRNLRCIELGISWNMQNIVHIII